MESDMLDKEMDIHKWIKTIAYDYESEHIKHSISQTNLFITLMKLSNMTDDMIRQV